MRKTILFLALGLLFCGLQESRAAVFSSSQNGNWSSSATWGNAGVPGNGDTVTITHQVAVDANTIVGHSPGTDAAAAAVRITSSGHLILNPGITLVCRGDLRLQPGYLTLQAGSVLEMDSSQAASPALSVYKIDIQPDYGSNNALLTVNGTAVNHCEVRANTAGAHARIDDGNNRPNGGRMIADYCDFKRLGGDPDYQAWYYYPTGSGDLFRLQDCTFDQCSRVSTRYFYYNSCPAGSHVEFIRCVWTDSVANPGGDDYWEIFCTGAEYGAVNKVRQCSFDRTVHLCKARDYEIEDCVFQGGMRSYAGDWIMKSFKRNFICNDVPENDKLVAFQYGNAMEDCVFIKGTPGDYNPHFIVLQNGSGNASFRGNIFWSPTVQNNAEGDILIVFAPSPADASAQLVIEGNIFLPNGQGPDGRNNLSGSAFDHQLSAANTNTHITFRRNTAYGGSWPAACYAGETDSFLAGGHMTYLKSNLFVGSDLGSGQYMGYKFNLLYAGKMTMDALRAQDADYNAGYHLDVRTVDQYGASIVRGYRNILLSPGAVIGAHDVDNVDPQFVDNTRTPATWDAHLGGAGTLQGTMARLAPRGEHTMQELLDYIREGFRPQNPLLKNAGDPDDGSPDIGAVNMNPPLVAAPANLAAAAGGQTQIRLTWDDNSNNEEEFRIERSLTPNNAGFTQIAAAGAGTENYTDTGLTPGTTYYYRVRAYGSGSYSAYSNQAWAVTENSGGPFSITGTVTYNGQGLPGVTIGGLPGNPVTNASGQYTAIVNQGWSGTATPVLAGYTFNPANRTYNNMTSNQAGQNYTAIPNTYTISGTVTLNGNGLSGVTFNGLPGNPTTNASGQYTSTVNYNWSGTVTPTLAGYTFTPVNRTYSNVTSNQAGQNYTAAAVPIYTISGTVLFNGNGLSGVTFNGLPGNPTTNASGQYTATVNQGFSGTATPSLSGYTFNPAGRTYANVTVNQTGQDFTASASSSGSGSSGEGEGGEGGGGGGCFIGSTAAIAALNAFGSWLSVLFLITMLPVGLILNKKRYHRLQIIRRKAKSR